MLKLYKDPGYNDFLIKNSLINSSDSPKSRILKFEFQKIFWASSAYFSDDRETSEKRIFKGLGPLYVDKVPVVRLVDKGTPLRNYESQPEW